MISGEIARVAVSVATFNIDKPYDYRIPIDLTGKILPGMRVSVPFGRGNKHEEGIVLSVTGSSEREELKCILTVLDNEPLLTHEQIQLALWMHDRFFCTVYDAIRAMLPTGVWFRNGRQISSNKTEKYISLNISSEEAEIFCINRPRSPAQRAVIRLLSDFGSVSVNEVCAITGVSKSVITNLIKGGAIKSELVEVYRRPDYGYVEKADKLNLSSEQQGVFESLSEMLQADTAQAALLYGVTGSGKTSVYIKLIEECSKENKAAIVLLPEISLTPQVVRTFMSYFGDRVAVLHSSLGIGERYDEWKRIRSGEVDVVVGTRSAVFAPVSRLGMIIIDEEQESSYKSESTPRYHARDIAKFRCAKNNALLLAGSATPSVESMYSASQGSFKLLSLKNRFNARPLPEVSIVDMRPEIKNGNMGLISNRLREEIEVNLNNKEQTILFINRRGTNGRIFCPDCGATLMCPNCSVSLTYHSTGSRVMCHYCGYSSKKPTACPDCGGELIFTNPGTESLEEEIKSLFDGVKTLRMDADTVAAAGSHDILLKRFEKEKIPVLIGTQMVTKGLNFPDVTLVGVVSADQSLYANDFRANERTFDLITQVVGRGGRGEKTGRAIIQTCTPNSEILKLASRQDYSGFYEREIEIRRASDRPPIKDIFCLTVSGEEEGLVLRAVVHIKESLARLFSSDGDVLVLGPAPASLTKFMNKYRYTVHISCNANKKIRDTVMSVMKDFCADKVNKNLSIYTDFNPLG